MDFFCLPVYNNNDYNNIIIINVIFIIIATINKQLLLLCDFLNQFRINKVQQRPNIKTTRGQEETEHFHIATTKKLSKNGQLVRFT